MEINTPRFLTDVDEETSTRATVYYRSDFSLQLRNIWHFIWTNLHKVSSITCSDNKVSIGLTKLKYLQKPGGFFFNSRTKQRDHNRPEGDSWARSHPVVARPDCRFNYKIMFHSLLYWDWLLYQQFLPHWGFLFTKGSSAHWAIGKIFILYKGIFS